MHMQRRARYAVDVDQHPTDSDRPVVRHTSVTALSTNHWGEIMATTYCDLPELAFNGAFRTSQ